MKTSPVSFALLLALLLCPLSAQNPPTAAERDARAKKATEDRLAYAASADYNPYDTKNRDSAKSAVELLEKQKFPQAIAEVQVGLRAVHYDIDLLVILASAYRAAGDLPNADQTRLEWMSLVDSVLSSGDGRDFATAYRVINVAEEYAVLRVLGLRVTHQSLVEHGGSEFDLMQVKRPDSPDEITLYFNIDLPKKWLNKQFAKKAK